MKAVLLTAIRLSRVCKTFYQLSNDKTCIQRRLIALSIDVNKLPDFCEVWRKHLVKLNHEYQLFRSYRVITERFTRTIVHPHDTDAMVIEFYNSLPKVLKDQFCKLIWKFNGMPEIDRIFFQEGIDSRDLGSRIFLLHPKVATSCIASTTLNQRYLIDNFKVLLNQLPSLPSCAKPAFPFKILDI